MNGGSPVEDCEAAAETKGAETGVTELAAPAGTEGASRRSNISISCVSEPAKLLEEGPAVERSEPCEERPPRRE